MAKAKTKIELENENTEMQDRLVKMEEMMKSLLSTQNKPSVEPQQNNGSYNINIKKKIKVMSLFNGRLNLTTEGGGRGKIYSFAKFGETKLIPNEDLTNCFNANQRFFTEGFCFILDSEFVEENGLSESYANIVDKDKITSILNCDRNELDNIFQKISKIQKETICNLIIEKIVANEDINMTGVAIISQLTGVKIYDKAQESISYNDLIDGKVTE